MADFLELMAKTSARRAARARQRTPEAELRRRVASLAPAPRLTLSDAGFDVIAEIKRFSPRTGRFRSLLPVEERARRYAAAGAAAISVLTEPSRFGGALAHLERVASTVGVPAMRKDFVIDEYQLLEARALGAGGALLILRLLDDARLDALLEAARALGLFVLLEAFDADELARAGAVLARHAADPAAPVLVGLNARDLARLAVGEEKHLALRHAFPMSSIAVAESGVGGPADAARLAAAGYPLVLAGEVLMRAADPGLALVSLIAAGRRARAACA